MSILRPYQTDIAAEFERHVERGDRSILLVAPTGSGKTVIAAAIIAGTARRVLAIAHRREIVNQTSDKLTARGVAHGIIQSGDEKKLRPMAAVQVASIQTLHARAIRSSTMLMPRADLLIIDEAHHACAMTYKKVIEAYPNAIILGLTATPCRGDGRGLGGIFKIMIECPQVPDLIEQGYLVKARVYAPVDPDLRGVRTQAGDYVESQLAERMDRDQLVATSSPIGSSMARAARPSPSPAAWATASTSATSSSRPACVPSTSMAARPRMSARPSWRGSHPATPRSSPTAWF
jgi:DNA repair protein RadD